MLPLARFATVLALLSLAVTVSHAQVEEEWPVEITITSNDGKVTIQRPVGVVAGLGTTVYVATTGGQLYLTDVKTGKGEIINRGGDNQRFGGLCLDSRGPGTLYATGRESGVLYAFNRRGELLQSYQIEDASSEEEPVFLTGCIQTQYQLIIIDSLSPRLFYLPLADTGPSRGYPPAPDPQYLHQGFEMKYEGDWNQTSSGFNAYGVEWTQKFKKIAYVMNSATGQLYACTLTDKDVLSDMREVNVQGKMKLFPGALQILFDSANENVLYLSMPHLNAIAVLEISDKNHRRVKYIRMLTSALLDGPVAISEYGNFIYPVNGKLTSGPTASDYTLVQISRHRQIRDSGDPDQEFTTALDAVEETPLPTVIDSAEVEGAMRAPPAAVGTAAPVAIGTTPPPTTADSESTTSDDSTSASDDTTSASENPASPDPTDPNSESVPPTDSTPTVVPTPVSAPPDGSNPSDSSDSSTSVFTDVSNVEDDGDSGSACFPATATVRTEDDRHIRMDELRIGDRVLVGMDTEGQARYSDVYLFSHQDRTVVSSFIRIRTYNARVLELSDGHYLYVNGKLATAATVKVGDALSHAEDHSIRVVKTEQVRRRGLYNPQTVDGDIFVNGIRTSTYTSSVEPAVASALLAPLRAVHFCGTSLSRRITALLATGGNGIERFLPDGSRLYSLSPEG